MMPALWEQEVAFNRRLRRENGLTPYRELARWRHRFYFALLIALGEAAVILFLLPIHR